MFSSKYKQINLKKEKQPVLAVYVQVQVFLLPQHIYSNLKSYPSSTAVLQWKQDIGAEGRNSALLQCGLIHETCSFSVLVVICVGWIFLCLTSYSRLMILVMMWSESMTNLHTALLDSSSLNKRGWSWKFRGHMCSMSNHSVAATCSV